MDDKKYTLTTYEKAQDWLSYNRKRNPIKVIGAFIVILLVFIFCLIAYCALLYFLIHSVFVKIGFDDNGFFEVISIALSLLEIFMFSLWATGIIE
jgi:hypothetical protein